jgi:hypothetical protein
VTLHWKSLDGGHESNPVNQSTGRLLLRLSEKNAQLSEPLEEEEPWKTLKNTFKPYSFTDCSLFLIG